MTLECLLCANSGHDSPLYSGLNQRNAHPANYSNSKRQKAKGQQSTIKSTFLSVRQAKLKRAKE
jgi:hypothetical protein